MSELTLAMSRYRECLNLVWNRFFADHADWDERDNFFDAAVDLFRGIVLYPFEPEIRNLEILPNYRGDKAPFDPIRVKAIKVEDILMSDKQGTFRNTGRFPPDFPIEEVDLRYVDLYDFYELGPREFKFVEVEIVSRPIPEQLGLRLLIPFEDARFEPA